MRKVAFLLFALSVMSVSNLQASTGSLSDIKSLLTAHSNTLKPEVINTVLTSIQCANQHENKFNHILMHIPAALDQSFLR